MSQRILDAEKAEARERHDWVIRLAADIRDVNPDYEDFEGEVERMIRSYLRRAGAPARATTRKVLAVACPALSQPRDKDINAEMLAALKGAYKLPKPWIEGASGRKGTVTFTEWDAAFTAIEVAIQKAEGHD